MLIHVKDLIGPALDWAVATCEKNTPIYTKINEDFKSRTSGIYLKDFPYSTDWTQGGPIIDANNIEYHKCGFNCYRANIWKTHVYAQGHTLLIASMRCYVASKLGDKINIPDNL